MAEKPKKKPRHSHLVLPGEKKKSTGAPPSPPAEGDRLGRAVSAPATAPAAGVESPPQQPAPAGAKPFDIENSEPPAEETPKPAAPPPTVEELLESTAGQPAARKAEPPAHGGEPAAAPDAKPDAKASAPKSKPHKAKKKDKQPKARFSRSAPATPGPDDDLPENAIRLPRTGPRYTAARRKKQRRRVGILVVAGLVVLAILLYIGGFHLYVGMALRNATDSLRIAFTPSEGYPATFTLPAYSASQPMGSNGFAALGEKDFTMYSSGGVELAGIQHGYAAPAMSAGNTRVCLYSQGGREYTVEGRGSTIARRTTDADILFAELSSNGWLAVVTNSRYQAALEIYSPVYDEFEMRRTWPVIDGIPVRASFSSDNRSLALGCLAPDSGGMDSFIQILHTKKDEVLATIYAGGASLVDVEFLSSGRLLAVYTSYAALYDMQGAELARFDYGGRQFTAANISNGHLALALGSSAQENLELVFLDSALEVLFSTTADSAESPRVLATDSGVFLLLGQEVLAYSKEGALLAAHTLAGQSLDLVYGGQPLALCSGMAEPIGWMLETDAATPENTSSQAPPSQPASSASAAP